MKWNVSDKVKLIFGTIIFFLFFIGFFSYFTIKRLETNTEWIDHAHKIIHSLQRIYVDMKDAQTNYADFLLTQNKNYSKSCEKDLAEVNGEIQRADELVSDDPLWRKNMDDLQILVEGRVTTMRVGLAYVQAGRPDLAIAKIQSESEKNGNKEIKNLINRMSGMQIWLLKTRKDFENENTQKNFRFMAVGVLSIFFSLFFRGIYRDPSNHRTPGGPESAKRQRGEISLPHGKRQ